MNDKQKMYLYIFHTLTVFILGLKPALIIYFASKAGFYFNNWMKLS